MRLRRHHRPGIDDLREEWNEQGFRAAATAEPGFILIGVRDNDADAWAEIEIGTAQVDELIRLLENAHATAKQRLDAAVLPPDQR